MLAAIVKRHPHARLVHLMPALCDADICSIADGEKLRCIDTDHLTVQAARTLGPAVADDIAWLRAR